LPQNDLGNSERLLARFGQDLRETQRFGRFVWDGRHWVLDDGGIASRRMAQATAKAMIERELPALKQAGAEAKVLDGFFKFAITSANSARLTNMVQEALTHVQTPMTAWNAQPHLFNVPNGTLDLSGMEVRVRAHRRDDYITCMGGAPYDPDAECPLFRATLDRVLPEKPVREFVQRYFGASLIDSSGDQSLCIHHGGGANGKSTITDAVAHAMGSYAVTTDVAALLYSEAKAAGGGPQPSLIKLANGARLVRAAEPELGMRLSESLIKQLTGGEPIEARDMWAKPIEFIPRFKLSISCNARPPIRGGDHGIWRRLLLTPWQVQIPPEERDPTLPARLKREASGILNWLIDGLSDWHERGGLCPPLEVLAATEDYREDSDPVGRFLSEWCVLDQGARVEVGELHQAFTTWCEREQVKVLTLNFFGRRLTDRNIEKQKSDGDVYRCGLRLTAAAYAAVAAAKQGLADRALDREWRRMSRGRES
jgi:putative DNA primase/helicase